MGRFHCPRCDTQYTRPKSVKDHFEYCVGRYGNPEGLKWTDHPSLETAAKWRMKRFGLITESEGNDSEDDQLENGADAGYTNIVAPGFTSQ